MGLTRQAPAQERVSDLERQLADFDENLRTLRAAVAAGDTQAIAHCTAQLERKVRDLSIQAKSLRTLTPGPDRAALRRNLRSMMAQLKDSRNQVHQAQAGTLRGLQALFGQSEQQSAYTAQSNPSPTASLSSRRLGSA